MGPEYLKVVSPPPPTTTRKYLLNLSVHPCLWPFKTHTKSTLIISLSSSYSTLSFIISWSTSCDEFLINCHNQPVHFLPLYKSQAGGKLHFVVLILIYCTWHSYNSMWCHRNCAVCHVIPVICDDWGEGCHCGHAQDLSGLTHSALSRRSWNQFGIICDDVAM